ncbi:MAG: HD domain-containing phosphohydrolase [Chloroflexota bacterium]
MKILVVDDDDIALAMAKKILEKDRYEVVLAEDGEVALEILRRENIQIVISDWNMPKLTGIEFCRYLRSSPAIGYIYFILVTSRTSKDDLVQGLTAGADEFISKPFEPVELLVRVRNAERVLALETTSMMLFSLAKLAESKDIDTGNHLERIRAYAQTLAEQVAKDPILYNQIPPHFSSLLYQTSPLHDIGKVGIPDYILLKPGNLNDEEWKTMKRHAEIGAETLDACLKLNPSAEYLRIARDIAWAHHERWDGTGYPRGLKGEEIPLAARIVALADVFDALTVKRTYKAAMSHDVARGVILEGSGTHFDPMVVQAFLTVEEMFLQIRNNNPEYQ